MFEIPNWIVFLLLMVGFTLPTMGMALLETWWDHLDRKRDLERKS